MKAIANCPISYSNLEKTMPRKFQAAFWYCCNFGFARFAEKQTDKFVEIAIKNGKVKKDCIKRFKKVNFRLYLFLNQL